MLREICEVFRAALPLAAAHSSTMRLLASSCIGLDGSQTSFQCSGSHLPSFRSAGWFGGSHRCDLDHHPSSPSRLQDAAVDEQLPLHCPTCKDGSTVASHDCVLIRRTRSDVTRCRTIGFHGFRRRFLFSCRAVDHACASHGVRGAPSRAPFPIAEPRPLSHPTVGGVSETPPPRSAPYDGDRSPPFDRVRPCSPGQLPRRTIGATAVQPRERRRGLNGVVRASSEGGRLRSCRRL